MKKILSTAFTAAILLASVIACDSDDDNLNQKIIPEELPQAARAFVTAYFPDATYNLVEKQRTADSDSSLYQVLLSNQFEIDFDINGKWIDIDGNKQTIPTELIPAKIKDYITANYSGQNVTKFDHENARIEIELSNDTDLIFDLEGNFLKLDK